MNVLDRIDLYLQEKVRGFKNVTEIADFIVKMQSKVKPASKKKFEEQMKRSLSKVDPDGKMDVKDAVMKMKFKEAKSLYAALTGFSYDGLEEE